MNESQYRQFRQWAGIDAAPVFHSEEEAIGQGWFGAPVYGKWNGIEGWRLVGAIDLCCFPLES